jgi:hypothetical protein
MSRLKIKVLAVVVHAGMHSAIVVEQRSRVVAIRSCSNGSIVPEIAGVLLSSVTGVRLRDIGTEVENRPASRVGGGLGGDGRQSEKSCGVHRERGCLK